MPQTDSKEIESGDESGKKGIPWNWLYYVGTVLLGMSEREFWRSQPRKIYALWKEHKDYKKYERVLQMGLNEDEPEEVFIDQLGW